MTSADRWGRTENGRPGRVRRRDKGTAAIVKHPSVFGPSGQMRRWCTEMIHD
jgi:hypothetical protein